MIKKYIIFIFTFVLSMSVVTAMEHKSDYVILYDDFINRDSKEHQRLAGLSSKERVFTLFTRSQVYSQIGGKSKAPCSLDSATFEKNLALPQKVGLFFKSRCVIKDAPGLQDQEKTDLILEMKIQSKKIKYTLYDANGNDCFSGYTAKDCTQGYLETICATYQKGSIFEFDNVKRLITGTTALRIWEALSDFCAFEEVQLQDESFYDGFELRILLPYVQGCSWYGKCGYYPLTCQVGSYKRMISELAQRSCKEVMCNFKNTPVEVMMLLSLSEVQLPCNAPLGTLIQRLYKGFRYGDARIKVSCKALLSFIFNTCLKQYKCDDFTMKPIIEGMQSVINERKLVKRITRA